LTARTIPLRTEPPTESENGPSFARRPEHLRRPSLQSCPHQLWSPAFPATASVGFSFGLGSPLHPRVSLGIRRVVLCASTRAGLGICELRTPEKHGQRGENNSALHLASLMITRQAQPVNTTAPRHWRFPTEHLAWDQSSRWCSPLFPLQPRLKCCARKANRDACVSASHGLRSRRTRRRRQSMSWRRAETLQKRARTRGHGYIGLPANKSKQAERDLRQVSSASWPVELIHIASRLQTNGNGEIRSGHFRLVPQNALVFV
jgi:hypothetical protein